MLLPESIPRLIGTPAAFAAIAASALARSCSSSWACLLEGVSKAPVLSPATRSSCMTRSAESKRTGAERARGSPTAAPFVSMPALAPDEKLGLVIVSRADAESDPCKRNSARRTHGFSVSGVGWSVLLDAVEGAEAVSTPTWYGIVTCWGGADDARCSGPDREP